MDLNQQDNVCQIKIVTVCGAAIQHHTPTYAYRETRNWIAKNLKTPALKRQISRSSATVIACSE